MSERLDGRCPLKAKVKSELLTATDDDGAVHHGTTRRSVGENGSDVKMRRTGAVARYVTGLPVVWLVIDSSEVIE